MTKDEVDLFLKFKEWRYIKDAENIWHTGFRSRIKSYRRDFELFIVLLNDWLYVRVPLVSADNPHCWSYLAEYLLGLNYHLFLAKLSLQDGRVVLTVELPARCSMNDLNEAFFALDNYVQAYYLDIETVSTSPSIAALVHTVIQVTKVDDLKTQETPEIIFN